MKEAAGEANLTVVAIILIAVVVAVATPLVRSLMNTSAYRSCCTDAGGVWEGGNCKAPSTTTNVNTIMAIDAEYNNCQVNSGISDIKALATD